MLTDIPENEEMVPQPDNTELENITRDVSERSDDVSKLLLEHLEAARFYRTGAMPEELAFNLKLVRELLPQLQDPGLRSRIDGFLRRLPPV